jgi:hypothetical protein
MTKDQIALYAGVTSGRVSNLWSLGKLASVKANGLRTSLRSDVDAMIDSRWKRA